MGDLQINVADKAETDESLVSESKGPRPSQNWSRVKKQVPFTDGKKDDLPV